MATSDKGRSPVTLDSDEIDEMYCEHCERGFNRYTPAKGFCPDCVEYMCDTCLGYHKLYMAAHSIQDKNTMPQDFCLDKCSIHTDQLIKFYCDDCQKIACCQCKTIDHASCTKVSHISKVAAGIENSKEMSDLIQDMDGISKKVDQIERKINSRILSVSEQEAGALSSITKQKEKMLAIQEKKQREALDNFDREMEETIAKLKEQRRNLIQQSELQHKKLVDKLNDEESDVMRRVQNIKNSNHTGLNSLKARNMKIQSDMNTLRSDLKKQQKIGQRCKLYIAMKRAQKCIQRKNKYASKTDDYIDLYFDSFSVKPELGVYNLGSDVNEHGKYFCFKHLVSSRRERNVSYHSEIGIKHVFYSSLCFLSETTLLMSDYNGKCIIVLQDIANSTNRYETVSMPSFPWAISKIADKKVAVTFPQEKVIRLIAFSETLNVASTVDIQVGAECRGIVYRNDNFIVSCSRPAKFLTLDMSGNVLKTFDKYLNGQPLFERPKFLALSLDKTVIYVSDFKKHTVTSMTFDGKVIAVYQDPQLKGPLQMTVDSSGTVYVCGELSANIHQLSSDLTRVKILLENSNQLNIPVSVAYSSFNDKLYVGLYNNKTIKVFNLSLS